MIQPGDQRQELKGLVAPARDRNSPGLNHLSLPPLHSLPSLDETKAAGLIGMADTAKRLSLNSLSNLIFAHVAHGLGHDLPSKIFIEKRTLKGYLGGRPPRYYDLFSLQISEPKAYLCIPYPLVHPAVARCLEAMAQPTPQVIHARKFPWATTQERNAESKKLALRFFGHFSEEADLRGLISTAAEMLEHWESKRCVRQLHYVARTFFEGTLPASLRTLEGQGYEPTTASGTP